MKTIAQINWTAAIITSIIVVACIAYFLRRRCKEIIYLFTILGPLVTIFCFSHVGVWAKIAVPFCYMFFAFVLLAFDSFKTPEDSLLNKDKPNVINMKYDIGDVWE